MEEESLSVRSHNKTAAVRCGSSHLADVKIKFVFVTLKLLENFVETEAEAGSTMTSM
jgi:hypothetical protein